MIEMEFLRNYDFDFLPGGQKKILQPTEAFFETSVSWAFALKSGRSQKLKSVFSLIYVETQSHISL